MWCRRLHERKELGTVGWWEVVAATGGKMGFIGQNVGPSRRESRRLVDDVKGRKHGLRTVMRQESDDEKKKGKVDDMGGMAIAQLKKWMQSLQESMEKPSDVSSEGEVREKGAVAEVLEAATETRENLTETVVKLQKTYEQGFSKLKDNTAKILSGDGLEEEIAAYERIENFFSKDAIYFPTSAEEHSKRMNELFSSVLSASWISKAIETVPALGKLRDDDVAVLEQSAEEKKVGVLPESSKTDEERMEEALRLFVDDNVMEVIGLADQDESVRSLLREADSDFSLKTAIALAEFAFEIYNHPKAAFEIESTDGCIYYLSSDKPVRKLFSGLIMMSVKSIDYAAQVLAPSFRIVVGGAQRRDPGLNATLSFYTEHLSDVVQLELWTTFPQSKKVGSASFITEELGTHGEAKDLEVDIYEFNGKKESTSSKNGQKKVATVVLEGSFFDIRSTDDTPDDYDEDDDDDVNDGTLDVEEADQLSDEEFFFSTATEEDKKTVEGIMNDPTAEDWSQLNDLIKDQKLGLSKMERMAMVKAVDTDTEYGVWRKGKRIVFSFRGTEQTSWKDLLTDSMIFLAPFEVGGDTPEVNLLKQRDWFANSDKWGGDVSAVHYGFLRAYASVRPSLLESIRILEADTPGTHIFVTGHSLGGALATLFAGDIATLYPDMKITMYNFGSPKVGNGAFVKKYNSLVPDSFRLINNSDIVARMPRQQWRFAHISRCILVTQEGFLWVDEGTTECRERLREKIYNAMLEEMDGINTILEKSPTLLSDHMEDAYFASLLRVQFASQRE